MGYRGSDGFVSLVLRVIAMNHPHPDKRHVMKAARAYLVAMKRKYGTARALGHYHALLQTYLTAKRSVV